MMNEVLRRICRCNFCTCSPWPWLFVGLGNPGDKYRGTRHNVGFEMLDAFAESRGIHMETVHCKAMFGKGFVNGIPVLLAKPLTYMNLSGESARLQHITSFLSIVWLWLKSVIYHFRGNREFPRLRIGIGRPPGQMDPKAFMLQKFNATARERIDAALLEGSHALEQVLSKGFSESSKCFNTTQKYKHIRLQTLPT